MMIILPNSVLRLRPLGSCTAYMHSLMQPAPGSCNFLCRGLQSAPHRPPPRNPPPLQQVKEWIEAWRGSAAAETDPAPAAPVEVPSVGAPTSRVTEPTLPPSATAVLSAMTTDAPVANTPVDAGPDAAALGHEQQQEPEPVLAAVAAPAASAGPAEAGPAAAEKEAAYKARIAAAVRALPR